MKLFLTLAVIAFSVIPAIPQSRTQKRVESNLYNRVIQLTSAAERKAIVRTAPVAEKLKMWQVQMDYALANETLTWNQRVLIQEAKTILTPHLYDNPNDLVNNALYERIKVEFGKDKDLYRRTFEIPGNAKLSDNITCGAKKPETISLLAKRDCDCNWSLGCDSPNCNTPWGGCNPVINCGVFGAFSCYYSCGQQ